MFRSGEDNVYGTGIWDRAALSQTGAHGSSLSGKFLLFEEIGLQRSGDEHGPGKVESISSFYAALTRS